MSTTTATATAATAAVMGFRRLHPGGGPLGRCSYGLPGVTGIVVADVGMFANPEALPPAIVLAYVAADGTLQPVPMAQPVSRKVAAVTSAVVAQANAAATAAAAAPAIAAPAEVAKVAAAKGAEVVAAAATAAAKPAARLVKASK